MPRRSLAVAWLITLLAIIAASLVEAGQNRGARPGWPMDIKEMIERNRRTVGELFAEKGSQEGGRDEGRANERVSAVSGSGRRRRMRVCNDSNLNESKKTLLQMPGPEILKDSRDRNGFEDADEEVPHVRIKRILNSSDAPFRSNASSLRSHTRNRRSSRTFGRFAPDESIPADESEAEYSSGVIDDNQEAAELELDVDFPGGQLDDEVTNKRNRLEDVYPEVKEVKEAKREEESASGTTDMRKVVVERDAGEEGRCVYVDADAEADAEANADELYYDDEESSQIANEPRIEKRKSSPDLSKSSKKNSKPNKKNSNSHTSMDKNKVAHHKTTKKPTKQVKKDKPKSAAMKPQKSDKKKPNPSKNSNGKNKKQKPSKAQAKAPTGKKSKIHEAHSSNNGNRQLSESLEASRAKRNREVLAACGRSRNGQRANCFKKSDDRELRPRDRTAQSIGELKDLLGRLMTKIEDLRDIMSEVRSTRDG